MKKLSFMKYGVLLSSICVMSLTGCSVRMPVVMPDDRNVSKLVASSISDIDRLSVDFDGSITFSSVDGNEHIIKSSGVISGDITSIMHGVIDRSESTCDGLHEYQDEWYLDVVNDSFYELTDNLDWVGYKDGLSVYDFSWWYDVVANIDLKYSGNVETSDGQQAMLLDKNYSGTDLEILLQHLHVNWNADVSQSDMMLSLYVDRWSGVPLELVVSFVESGMPIVVDNDGVKETLTDFSYVFKFSDNAKEETLPGTLSDLVLYDNVYTSLGITDVNSNSLSLNDYSISFDKNDIFDSVSVDSTSKTIDVASSLTVDGVPSIYISVGTGLDAYSVANSDRTVAFDFYKESGLSEIEVTDVMQFSVDGYEAYQYKAQYTDIEKGFVNTNYGIYISLTETSYVKLLITSITDRGANIILTDNYVTSILEQLSIIGGDNND